MLQIVCGDDFEFSTVSGNFTCTLYWQTESGDFPCEGWTDFAGVVLKWWVDAYFCVQSSAAEFIFMDGPYRIKAVRQGGELTLQFLRDDVHVLPDPTVNADELGGALLKAVRRLKSGLARAGRREEEVRADGLLKMIKTLSSGLAQQ